jgi:hypothetical protein
VQLLEPLPNAVQFNGELSQATDIVHASLKMRRRRVFWQIGAYVG